MRGELMIQGNNDAGGVRVVTIRGSNDSGE